MGLTVKEAAAALGVSPRRVQALIKAQRLPAQKQGRDWSIEAHDLDAVRSRTVGYPKGRPRKAQE